MRNKTKNLIYALILLAALISTGTLGYMRLEGLGFLDALYFTVITVSSVGYEDINTSDESKIFTLFIIATGLILLFYIVSALVSNLVEINVLDILRSRQLTERLKKMENHIILCGYGDVGSMVADGLGEKGFVIVDKDEERITEVLKREYVGIHGDATHPETLQAAGVEKAKAIIIALDSDPASVYTILTAKELNPEIEIYVRANEKGSYSKMKRAGANYVICLPAVGSNEILKAMGRKPEKTC